MVNQKFKFAIVECIARSLSDIGIAEAHLFGGSIRDLINSKKCDSLGDGDIDIYIPGIESVSDKEFIKDLFDGIKTSINCAEDFNESAPSNKIKLTKKELETFKKAKITYNVSLKSKYSSQNLIRHLISVDIPGEDTITIDLVIGEGKKAILPEDLDFFENNSYIDILNDTMYVPNNENQVSICNYDSFVAKRSHKEFVTFGLQYPNKLRVSNATDISRIKKFTDKGFALDYTSFINKIHAKTNLQIYLDVNFNTINHIVNGNDVFYHEDSEWTDSELQRLKDKNHYQLDYNKLIKALNKIKNGSSGTFNDMVWSAQRVPLPSKPNNKDKNTMAIQIDNNFYKNTSTEHLKQQVKKGRGQMKDPKSTEIDQPGPPEEIKTKYPIKEMISSDFIDASYRVAALQLTTVTKKALLSGLDKLGWTSEQGIMFSKLMDSEYGNALVSGILGYALTYMPKLSNDARAARLAKEFRVNSMTIVGNTFVTALVNELAPILSTAIGALPSLTEEVKTRVAHEQPKLKVHQEDNSINQEEFEEEPEELVHSI